MQNNNYDLIIIGGGAAGIIAAGRAAEKGANVLLLEKMRSVGRKMLISGKGRCNITNDSYASNHMKQLHPKPKFLKFAYKNFFKDDIMNILDSQGLVYKTERGNRVFPESNKSKDVLNAFSKWALTKNVEVRVNSKVEKLIVENGKCVGVEFNKDGRKQQIKAKAVILATGGKSYPLTGSTGDGYSLVKAVGHSIITPRPALVPVETKGNLAQRLMGLSLKNTTANLWVDNKKVDEEFGEMLFTHYGLTGPIILTLSRQIVIALAENKKVEIRLNLKPALDDQKLDKRLIRDLDENGKKYIENIFKLWMPSKLVKPLMELCGIDSSKLGNQINGDSRRKIKQALTDLTFEVNGHRPFSEAIITQGGVSIDEINNKSMQSNIVEGLYFAGEVMDIDANTGGYNFQAAYSSAALAVDSIFRS
ncbi:MAG: aminoacetone oxidase family FAD-binding enzyme [Bacteroidetes bacterium]|nr:MAG: aminoacetone oxidase family FAD-binding enzyme [Bacteroidota bacterium]